MSIDTTSSEASSQIQLDIGGMTCASCAARIEKKLNRMDGRHRFGELRNGEGKGHLRRHRHRR